MEEQTKEQLSRFIEKIEIYSSKLNGLEKDIQNNEFDIKMLAQDINVYTNDFLYDVYGLKVYTEYPD
ncbi:hypothetical protein CD110_00375 [Staphylococcus casei]|uniref:hypothetical protein n=1 Tax=Staphylococcus TaxID=1279 RepID=UPI000CD059D7|nr:MULTISPECIES: hypothetical protein [Staphylococcus]PTI73484.1 hypothetical protein BU064_13650 [Staphylococcus succinus]PNZ63869.1 hypothetical protein CD110_00375 [Staphylococcus casei]PTF22599.1 hypothetical protein BUY30_11880 [Staphylococcus cohnii]RIL83076.1 hypothetical protein BUY23_12020 [Staphylococcus cohnii]WJE87811.1 hypothetical protein QMO72_13975 [Staphylococcus casei]